MNSVEDQIRAATRAAAESLREVRPLRLPPEPGARPGPGSGAPARRARRFRPWIAPLAAAAAVIAIAISLVLVRDIPNGPVVPPTVTPVNPEAVPEYYVALPGADNFANVPGAPTAVVGDTFSGKRLFTLRPSGKDKFVSVSAAADDRTFVLGANPDLSPPAVPSATTWYLVRLSPGTKFSATVRKLGIPGPPSGGRAGATALSPDGTELALLGTQPVSRDSDTEFLRVYSVATGALLHAWSGQLDEAGDAYTTLSWTAGGRGLAIGYTWSAKSGQYLGVRTLDVTRPGHDLVADSRLTWSVKSLLSVPNTYPLTCAVAIRVVVTADGTVVCGGAGVLRAVKQTFGGPACPAIPAWDTAGFLEYSTVTGALARTVYRTTSNCFPGGDDVLWATASGRTVVGYIQYGLQPITKTSILRFGAFSDGTFTPLPVPPTTTTTPNAIAW